MKDEYTAGLSGNGMEMDTGELVTIQHHATSPRHHHSTIPHHHQQFQATNIIINQGQSKTVLQTVMEFILLFNFLLCVLLYTFDLRCMQIFYFAFFRALVAPEGVPNMFSPSHGPRPSIRPPGASPQMPPQQMVHSPGTPQMMSNHGQMGPGTPQMGPSTPQMGPGTPQMGMGKPQMGPGTPQMGPGTPQMGPGTPQMGSGPSQMGPGTPKMGPGTPQMGPGTPQMGPGTPQMGTNVPQMASPRMAPTSTQMSPGTPQMPNISQGMSMPSPQQMAMAQQRAVAPKLEPPDTMDARTMWLPKRMNHCKLLNFYLHLF